ncbi:SH3 domain-containing protein, partial [Bacillus sp. SD088]|uniref:SH3 domain-containing protein n=1 Tax=Bacillus sp. SD088 TaxID=2782012 RepID=UPI001A970A12
MKKRVILPSLCFAVLSTVAFEQTIQAAEPPSGIESQQDVSYVSVDQGSSLNMRAEASTSASIVSKLANGTSVIVISEANGWAKISANGKTGFVSKQYLTTGKKTENKPATPKPTSVKTETKYVSVNAGSTLNLRSSANGSASIIANLKNGTTVSVESESNGWAKVKVNGKTGYVSSQFLTGKKSSTPSKPSTPSTSAPSKTETKYVSVDAGSVLNLRSSASASASIIGSLKNGIAVSVESESNGWAKVKVNGKTGYVSGQFLTGKTSTNPSKPSTPAPSKTETKYVSVDAGSSLNLRSSASASASIIASLKNGIAVSVESESNGWAKVKVNGKTGYVSSQFLSGKTSTNPSKPSTPAPSKTETKYVSVDAGSSLNLRSSASASASIIG